MGKQYLKSKLSDILYRMSIHQGDAKSRLCSEIINLGLAGIKDSVLYIDMGNYKNIFNKLVEFLDSKNSNIPRLKNKTIRNNTASSYIKMLLYIKCMLE